MLMNFWFPAVLILGYVHLLFMLAILRKDNSIIDIAWGLGFVLVAWGLYFQSPHPNAWSLLIPVSLWGIRLSVYLFIRNRRSGKEDWRYAAWREQWGSWVYVRAYLQVFLLQGLFMWIISLPLMGSSNLMHFTWLQILGGMIFLTGFLWESFADAQLLRFKAKTENKGKVMRSGLWRLSRHPNYFGEMLVWWGIFLISISWVPWYIGILSPLTISGLLWKVSGVPMLEQKYADNPDYQAYIKSTPALIPSLKKI